LSIDVENTFRFQLKNIAPGTKLIMTNYPHNPSGRVSDRKYWEALCEYCSENNIRLFNDAAYYGLSHSQESCSLTEVATDFPELSWCEAFTAAKLIGNATGWQIGAIAGSPDFIGDIAVIKGNTDEGFVAPMAAGVNASVNTDLEGILDIREIYRSRLVLLIDILVDVGMKLAIKPEAGFFTLWMIPQEAFGQKIDGAEHFNLLMMEHSGIIGVHFEPLYIRYAVCEDIIANSSRIADAFKKAKVAYI
jgi:aspartate/methionine/tyrosine aminotransferase